MHLNIGACLEGCRDGDSYARFDFKLLSLHAGINEFFCYKMKYL